MISLDYPAHRNLTKLVGREFKPHCTSYLQYSIMLSNSYVTRLFISIAREEQLPLEATDNPRTAASKKSRAQITIVSN